MGYCIFCCKEVDDSKMSKEHIFPDAIGGTFTLEAVCKEHNDTLGNSVDCHLTDHWFIQGERMLLGLSGKSGIVPNPIERGMIEGNKAVYEMVNGVPQKVYMVPSVIKTPQDDGSEYVTILLDKRDEHKKDEIIEKMISRYKKKGINIETKDIERREERVETPMMKLNAAIDLFRYKRAMVKIAYEYAFYHCGQMFLSDPVAAVMRDCIFDDKIDEDISGRYPLRGRIDLIGGEKLFPFLPDTKDHIAMLIQDGNNLCVYIRIFHIFYAVIYISENARQYGIPFGGYITIVDPVNKTTVTNTLVSFIERGT